MSEKSTSPPHDEDFGDLPDGWRVVRLADVADLCSGGTPSKQRPEFWNGNIPWASPKDLKRLRLADTEDHISEAGLEDGSRLVPAGAVFIVVRGMILSRDVPVALATVPMALNQDMKAIIARSDIDSEFLLYGLSAYKHRLRHEIGSAAHGTKRISTSAIESFRLPMPSLPEQRAIAHVLRTVQQAKEAAAKVIVAARQLKQSLMRHLFTYGPVPFDQADRVPLKETAYGQVPEDWSIRALNECATVQTGVAKGRRIDNGEAVEVPYLRVANVQDGYLDLAEIKNITIRRSETARYSLQSGDVVLTEGGDFDKLGRGFIWNGEVPGCVHQNHIFAVRSNRAVLVPEFLAYLTQSAYGKSYFLSVAHKTTNLACINTTKLKALPVLLPGLKEQHKIVAALQAVDHKIEVEMRKSRGLDTAFQTLLHNLMTGKVRVHDVPAFAKAGGGA